MFDTAFFGYSELPDAIDLDGKELVPLKSIRLKYQGTSQKTPFDVSNLRNLCKILGIEIHRPVKGLYCIEKHYAEFFDFLHSFYKNNIRYCFLGSVYYYNHRGDLMFFNEKLCDGQMIQSLFHSYIK